MSYYHQYWEDKLTRKFGDVQDVPTRANKKDLVEDCKTLKMLVPKHEYTGILIVAIRRSWSKNEIERASYRNV